MVLRQFLYQDTARQQANLLGFYRRKQHQRMGEVNLERPLKFIPHFLTELTSLSAPHGGSNSDIGQISRASINLD
jgi:hypothetical protein